MHRARCVPSKPRRDAMLVEDAATPAEREHARADLRARAQALYACRQCSADRSLTLTACRVRKGVQRRAAGVRRGGAARVRWRSVRHIFAREPPGRWHTRQCIAWLGKLEMSAGCNEAASRQCRPAVRLSSLDQPQHCPPPRAGASRPWAQAGEAGGGSARLSAALCREPGTVQL